MGLLKDYRQKGQARRQRSRAKMEEAAADLKEGWADTKIKAKEEWDKLTNDY